MFLLFHKIYLYTFIKIIVFNVEPMGIYSLLWHKKGKLVVLLRFNQKSYLFV